MAASETVPWDQDPAIWHLAAELVTQHGTKAPDIAVDMAEVLTGRGEYERARIWLRILDAARVLLAPAVEGLIPRSAS
jgi:hypothetical protein